jgi:hypothetical protein
MANREACEQRPGIAEPCGKVLQTPIPGEDGDTIRVVTVREATGKRRNAYEGGAS